jgi:hypothetical protein
MCRTVTRTVLGAALAAAGLASSVHAAPEVGEAALSADQANIRFQATDELNVPADAVRARPGSRTVPAPAAGGGCQQNGNFVQQLAGVNTIAYGATFNGTATNVTSRLDNFKVGGTGTQVLNAVSWEGYIQRGTSPNIVSAVPTGRNFIVSIWSSDPVSGEPSAAPISSQTVSPTFAADPSDPIASGNTAPGPATFNPYNFTATLATPVNLTAGQCYWIEIRPDPATWTDLLSDTTAAYFWRASNQGDGYMLRRFPNTGAALVNPTSRGIALGDLAFCLNVPTVSLADGLGCIQPTQMTCSADPTSRCQAWDASGNAFASHAVGTGFAAADNFTIGGSGSLNLTGGCFQGVYNAALGTVPASSDQFSITIYADQGGANPGVPGTIIDQRVVSTATGDLTRVPANQVANVFTFAGNDFFSWSFTLSTPIVLPAPGCYWLEVRSLNSTTPWFWMAKGNARSGTIADGFRQQKTGTNPYTTATQLFNGDFSWCLKGVAGRIQRSTSCVAIQPITNQTCATAQTITVGATAVFSNNIFDVPANALPPACGGLIPNRKGAWFKFTGTGQNVTVSTCNTGTDPRAQATNFDSTIFVYCSQGTTDPCTGPFICLGSNDDAADVPGQAACPTNNGLSSTLTVPTVSGATYYVYVSGVTATSGTPRGYFYLSAVNAGTPTNPAPACSTLANCRIDVPAGAQAEAEACGGRGTNGACATAEQLPLNTWATGTIEASNGTRDQDIWQLPDAQSLVNGGQWFTIDVRTEAAMTLAFFRSACDPVNGLTNGVGFTVPACTNGDTFNFFVPAGPWFVLMRTNSFDAPSCDAANRGNRYVFRARAAATGACCVAGSQCTVSVASASAGLAADPGDCRALGGVYLGNNTTCAPIPGNDNAPCDAGGGAPQTATTGACCDAYGNCYLSTSTTCTGVGATFTAGTTACAADGSTCGFFAARCCFPNGTCIVVAQSQCAGGTFTSSAQTCTPNACAQPPTGACCDLAGNCFTLQQRDCPVGGGVTWSSTQVCSPNPCSQPTACCSSTNVCTIDLPANCTAAGNTPKAPGTLCQPDPCAAPTTIICCRGSVCQIVNAGACTIAGGAQAGAFSAGAGTVCNAANNNASPCCKADYNKQGGVELLDIFAFLQDWFSNQPYADFTGQNGVDLLDIFAFLTAWFAGPCS